MKFTVTGINILNSQVGEGIRVGDKTIGTAIITGATFEDGKTLEDYAREGMAVGYDVNQPNPNEEGVSPSPNDVIKLNFDDIGKGTNYVFFVREPDNEDGTPGECNIIYNTEDIVNLFGLPAEDADAMKLFIGKSAGQRQLELVEYTDLTTDKPSMFFVNRFDREIVDALLDDDPRSAISSYQNMLNNPDFRSQLVTHSFIKTFLMVIVQSSQDRYNIIHRQDAIKKAAELISNITYWKDGVISKPSVKDVNDYVTEITENIRIS